MYSVQFQIAPPPGAALSDVPGLVRLKVVAWIKDWYHRWKQKELMLPVGTANLSPLPDHRIVVEEAGDAKGAATWAVTWSYPSSSDSTLAWQSRCEVASVEGNTEVSFAIRLESLEFIVAPQEDELRRPRIVKSLLESFPCTLNGRTVPWQPTLVGVRDIDAFVRDHINSGVRRLPLVLVSRDPISEQQRRAQLQRQRDEAVSEKEFLAFAEQENQALTEENAALKRRVSEAEAEVETAKANLQAVWSTKTVPQQNLAEIEEEPPDPTT